MLISKLGLSLKNLSEYLRSIPLQKSDEVTINKISNFLSYTTQNSVFIQPMQKQHYKTKNVMLSENCHLKDMYVCLFRTFVMEQMKNILKQLDKMVVKLQDLSKYTMAITMTFSVRRGGEPMKLILDH